MAANRELTLGERISFCHWHSDREVKEQTRRVLAKLLAELRELEQMVT